MLNQFFVFFNFGILVAILVYAWIRFGVPYIAAEQDAQRVHDAQRDEQYTMLVKKQHAVEKQIIAATIRRERLLLGMKRWSEAMQQQKKQRVIESEMQSQKICTRMSEQYTAIQKRCFQKRILQPAAMQAESELLALYHSDEVKARSFVETICKQVHKEVI